MIKVMNIISDTNIGGAGRVLLNYVKHYDKDKFNISVALPRGSELTKRLEQLGIQVFQLDIRGDKSFDKGAIAVLKKLIKCENPDLIHTHGSFSGRIAAKSCGKKIIYTRHCAFPLSNFKRSRIGKFINRKINLHYADMIIAVGNATRDNLIDSGIPEGHIVTMMNGSEKLKKLSDSEISKLKKSFGIKPDEFVIGILARIEKYKGYDDLIDSIEILLSRGLKVRLIVAGKGTYETNLKRRIKEKLLEDTVIFTGFIENVAEILSIMDVQVNASYESETSSLSIIEGLSMGIPAVVSNCGGNPLLVDSGVNGYVFPMRDSLALAKGIEKMATNKELYVSMSKVSERIYEERFTAEKFAKKIENVYRKVMKDYGK